MREWECTLNGDKYHTYSYKDWISSTITTCAKESINNSISSFVTQDDMDKYLSKIYKIITQHIKLDISEEEFMDILKE